MKQICLFTTGVLPVPATKGGAVESLTELLVDRNEEFRNYSFTILSIYEENAEFESKKYLNSNFVFIKISKIVTIVDKYIYLLVKFIKPTLATKLKNIVSRLSYIKKCKKILLKNSYDIVIAENNHSLFLVLKDKKINNKYKDKFIYHSHNEPYRDLGCKDIIHNTRKIICVSEYIKKCYQEKYSLQENQLVVLKNGIKIEEFDNELPPTEYSMLRDRFNIKKTDYVIVFAGRLIKEKGLLNVVKAYQQLNVPNKKLLIIGGVFFNTGVTNSLQEEIVNSFDGDRYIPIFTGYVNHSELWKYYKISDVAVLPSLLNESALLTNVEASLCKLPVITTNLGGIKEYINEESTTVLSVDNNLVDNIQKELLYLYNNREDRINRGLQNYKYAIQYSANNFYKSFCKIIEDLW